MKALTQPKKDAHDSLIPATEPAVNVLPPPFYAGLRSLVNGDPSNVTLLDLYTIWVSPRCKRMIGNREVRDLAVLGIWDPDTANYLERILSNDMSIKIAIPDVAKDAFGPDFGEDPTVVAQTPEDVLRQNLADDLEHILEQRLAPVLARLDQPNPTPQPAQERIVWGPEEVVAVEEPVLDIVIREDDLAPVQVQPSAPAPRRVVVVKTWRDRLPWK